MIISDIAAGLVSDENYFDITFQFAILQELRIS